MLFCNFHVYLCLFQKNEDTWNFPLHPSSPLTFGESLLLILSFKLRHGLSKQALNDLLELFNSHFPNTFDSSIFLFLKKFSDAKSDLQVHFLCNNCNNYLGMFIGEIRCEFCNHVNSVDVNKKNKSFFYYMPLGKQIELLLQERSIVECLFSHIVHAGDEQPNFNFKTQNSFNLSLLLARLLSDKKVQH